MVRAILEGKKTQTRRVVKLTDSGRVKAVGKAANWHLEDPNAVNACPYGRAGDRLWVRETWAVEESLNATPPSKFSKWPTWFAADGGYLANNPKRGFHTGKPRGRWRPSIHMPRWASRITLEITDVRVERLQEIRALDAISEGIESVTSGGITTFRDYLAGTTDRAARQSFETLWQSINGPESWRANPWVWVVEFKRIEL